MTENRDARVITKDLGRGASTVTPYGEPSNRSGEVRDLRTRINAPAPKPPPAPSGPVERRSA
jgi:hypothetical protein